MSTNLFLALITSTALKAENPKEQIITYLNFFSQKDLSLEIVFDLRVFGSGVRKNDSQSDLWRSFTSPVQDLQKKLKGKLSWKISKVTESIK